MLSLKNKNLICVQIGNGNMKIILIIIMFLYLNMYHNLKDISINLENYLFDNKDYLKFYENKKDKK